MRDLDFAPWQLEVKYDLVMDDWLPNQSCKRNILEKVKTIRRAADHIYGFVKSLNNTQIHQENPNRILNPMTDPDVAYHYRQVINLCSGNACYEAMKILLFYVKENDAYGQ